MFEQTELAINEFAGQLSEELAKQLKLLLEEKHLYQKVSVDPEPIQQRILAQCAMPGRNIVEEGIRAHRESRLVLASGSVLSMVPRGGGLPTVSLCLIIKNVRLFCVQCDERNVFSPVWFRDVSNELAKSSRQEPVEVKGDLDSNQLIFVALQCQHCKGLPEGFLVRRAGWRLSLEGRSPIENIVLPTHIPKVEAALYRDALITWYAGKKLAAVFYLRAFIEQFARRQAKITERKTGDEIMDTYAQTLPPDKRQTLPSLKEWYDKLSAPIHTADENAAEALFDTAREAIEQHFEIRRVFKIPDA